MLFFVIGVSLGCVTALLFLSFRKNWAKWVTTLADFVFGGATVPLLSETLELSNDGVVWCLLTVFASSFFAFWGLFYKMLQIIKTQNDGLGEIRTADILLQYDKFLEQYYGGRNAQNELVRRVNRVELREAEVGRREEAVTRREEEYANQVTNGVCLELPDGVNVLLTMSRVRTLPRFCEHLCRFSVSVRQWTQDCLSEHVSNPNVTREMLSTYLTHLGMLIESNLFGVGPNSDVRVHFRVLSDNAYNKLIVIRGGRRVKDNLTPIPTNEENLIDWSYRLNRSLVASADKNHVFETNSMWGDFLTYSFRGIGEADGHPLLSLGISLKYSEQHQDLLYLLCYCRFEQIIQEGIDKLNAIYGIGALLQQMEGTGDRVVSRRKNI